MISAVSGDRAVLCHEIDYHRVILVSIYLDQESCQISILKIFSEKQKLISVQELLVPCSWGGVVVHTVDPS